MWDWAATLCGSERSLEIRSETNRLARRRGPSHLAWVVATIASLLPAWAGAQRAPNQHANDSRTSTRYQVRTSQQLRSSVLRQASGRMMQRQLQQRAARTSRTRDLDRLRRLNRSQRRLMTRAERQRLVSAVGLHAAALLPEAVEAHNTNYSNELKYESVDGHIQNQRNTGRCWAFGGCTMLTAAHYERSGEHIPLSQSSVNRAAWGRRAAAMIKQIEDSDAPVNMNELGEGGWFHWAADIFENEGVVPQSAMPDTIDGMGTSVMIERLREIMSSAQRQFRALPRGPAGEAQRKALRSQTLRRANALLDMTIGQVPERFTHNGQEHTPQSFAREYLGFNAKDFVVLSNYGGRNARYNRFSRISGHLGLPAGRSFNVSQKVMREAVKNSIDQGHAVWFAAEVGGDNPYIVPSSNRFPESMRGVMSVEAFDFDSLVETGAPFSKAMLSEGNLNEVNHAMTFTAYDTNAKGEIVKFKVDNSWGTEAADGGHQHMYPGFFNRFVNQVVVPRKALPPATLAKLEAAEAGRGRSGRPGN